MSFYEKSREWRIFQKINRRRVTKEKARESFLQLCSCVNVLSDLAYACFVKRYFL